MKKTLICENKSDRRILLFSLYISILLSFFYLRTILLPNAELILNLHQNILDGTAPSPYNFRLLATYSIEAISFLTQILTNKESSSIALSVAIFTSFWLTLFYFYLAKFLQKFHRTSLTFLGLISCGLMTLIVFQDHYHQPWSFSEAALYAATFYYATSKKWFITLIITILASSNRITGIFIPFIYLCCNIELKSTFIALLNSNKNVIGRAITLSISAILTIFIIRLIKGNAEHVHTVYEILEMNTTRQNLLMFFVNTLMFLGPFWLYSFKGYKLCNKTHKMLLISILPYLSSIAIFGIWKEVRMLLPFYPIFISLGLFYLGEKLK